MSDSFNRKLFGQKLKAIRINYGYTQAYMAQKTGYSQNTISNWENGNREPESINDLINIANFYNVNINYFIDDTQQPLIDWRKEVGLEPDQEVYQDFLARVQPFSKGISREINERIDNDPFFKELIVKLMDLNEEKLLLIERLVDNFNT